MKDRKNVFALRLLMHKPDDDGSGYDAPSPTRSESTLPRNEAGAGEDTIAQSLKIFTRVNLNHL